MKDQNTNPDSDSTSMDTETEKGESVTSDDRQSDRSKFTGRIDAKRGAARQLPRGPSWWFSNTIVILGIVFWGIFLIKNIVNYGGWPEFPYSAGYFILPALFLVGLLFSFRLPQPLRINIALSLGSFFFAIFAVEAYLTVQIGGCRDESNWDRCQIALRNGHNWDTRSRIEVMSDIESKGEVVWPYTRGAPDFTVDGKLVEPLGGISQELTIYCNESGDWVFYESDEYGFRNPLGLYNTELKVALVGDSFTLGYCVDSESTIGAVVRNKYERTLTVARDGNGPLEQLGMLKIYLSHLRPEAVVWLFYEGNDLEDLHWDKENPIRMEYLEEKKHGNLFDKQTAYDQHLRDYALDARASKEDWEKSTRWRRHFLIQILNLTQLSRLIDKAIKAFHENKSQPDDDNFPFDPDLFQAVLQDAKDTVSSWGGTMYFVYLPTWSRYGSPLLSNPHHDQVISIAKTLDLPIIDIVDEFAVHNDPLSLFPSRLYGHYNKEGYRLVGESILETLETGVSSP